MNTLLLLWLAAHSCDTVTTHIALGRGGIERNPFLTQSPWKNDTIMVSEAVVAGLVTRKLATKHRRIAAVIAVAGLSISSYAAVHNLHTLQVQR